MIALDDSQLLILAGPPGEGDVYRLVLFDLSSRSVVPVADFTGTPTSKPEAIALVGRSAGETGETLQLILLRDGEDAIDGAPTLVTVRLPAN